MGMRLTENDKIIQVIALTVCGRLSILWDCKRAVSIISILAIAYKIKLGY